MPRRMYSHLRSIGRSIGRSRPSAPDSSHPFWPIISRAALSRPLLDSRTARFALDGASVDSDIGKFGCVTSASSIDS